MALAVSGAGGEGREFEARAHRFTAKDFDEAQGRWYFANKSVSVTVSSDLYTYVELVLEGVTVNSSGGIEIPKPLTRGVTKARLC